MSSLTTAIPSGPITTDWCIQAAQDFYDKPNQCANTTLGQTPADFESICCDGAIVDNSQNLYARKQRPLSIDLANLTCCRVYGPQTGGIGPINNVGTACTAGTPTPLARLAATNTANAALYRVTYTSASFGETATGDYIPTETPTCLWAYTKTGVTLRNVTVLAAEIMTLPPATTDIYGRPIYSTSAANGAGAVSSYEVSQSTGRASATSTATTSAALGGNTTSAHWMLKALMGISFIPLLCVSHVAIL